MSTDDMKPAADRAEARSALSAPRDLILETPEDLAKEAKVKRAEALKLEKAASAARARAQAVARAQRDARAEAQQDPPDARPFEFWAGAPDDDVWPEIKRNGEPVKGSMLNAEKAIERLKLSCRRDTFSGTYIVESPGMGLFVGELDDALVRKFRELCFEKLDYEPGKEAAQEALLRMCEENSFNSLQAQLNVLKWDGVKRLDQWLTTYLGVEDTPLHRAQGRLVLMAAVRRAYDPGCVFQHVLVLEGPEGTDKSSTIKMMASGQAERSAQYFSDSPILHLGEREQQELTKGVWFYEIAELAGMRKADQHAVKRFITAEAERARAAYDRFNKSQPRVCIFIGTFNTDANTGALVEYLNPGDRRRWWPVEVGKVCPIDLAALQRDRWQLFAEALAQHTDDFGQREWQPLRLDKSLWGEAATEQKAREVVPAMVDRLSTLFARLRKRPPVLDVVGTTVENGTDYIVTDAEVWVSAKLVVELVGRWDPSGRNIPGAMGSLGWRRIKDTRGGAFPTGVRGYVQAIPDVDT
jgi:hypothetical protein